MSNQTMQYVRGGDGVMYEEVQTPEGVQYLPAAPGLQFRPVNAAGDKFEAIHAAEYKQQRADGNAGFTLDGAGNLALMQDMPRDPRLAKQKLKRLSAIERSLGQVMIDRVVPGASPDVVRISDDDFDRARKEYQQAVSEGELRRYEDEGGFIPLTVYAAKLVTKGGKVLRHALAGEVGMRGHTIVCLSQGYGEGNKAQVPVQIIGVDMGVGSDESVEYEIDLTSVGEEDQ